VSSPSESFGDSRITATKGVLGVPSVELRDHGGVRFVTDRSLNYTSVIVVRFV
jgi:hypothetical protein